MTFQYLLLILTLLVSPSVWAKTEGKTPPETKPQAESKPTSSSSGYSKGDKVEALWQGAWYKGTIEFPDKEGFCKVHFDGYWHSRDEMLPADRIRTPSKHATPDPADLKSGDPVEVYQGDHYKPAVFVEAKGNKAVVRYADGDKSRQETVPLYKVSKVQ